ncbi:DUF4038 domain-containing protein [Bacteroidota bacterium]
MTGKTAIMGLLTLLIQLNLSGQYHPWEVVSLSFFASEVYENPYSLVPVYGGEDMLQVTFKGESGEAEGRELTLAGFWDGENRWKVNFSAPCSGIWTYSSHSGDAGLHNKKGKVEVEAWTEKEVQANPIRNGLVTVRKTGEQKGHFFEYTNGIPFLWIGDTWWNWTQRKIPFETYEALVNDRAAKGFTLGQLFVPGNGWGRESSVLDETYTKLDLSHMMHVERMIQYANSKGITVWVHAWWSRENIDERIGEEKMMRWWKYLVSRLGAYNVIWTLAGEYNMYNNGGFDLDFWKRLGSMVDAEDPYDRIISLHNTPPFWDGGAEAPQWSTGSVLHDEEWLDYNQSQVGHGRYANEMIPQVIREEYSREPAKPIVVTEPWYEFVEGNPTGRDIRLAAWGAILSGAAGHTYGGGHVWLAHLPEMPSRGGTWPLEESFERNTFNYEGARSMQHLATFFNEVTWWEMVPHPELIFEYPQPFCLASPGNEYVIYLRYGGTFKLNMKEYSGEEFTSAWYNPATGIRSEMKAFEADGIVQFTCPGSYPSDTELKDWVLLIKKKQQ